jgi:hypothetical protein
LAARLIKSILVSLIALAVSAHALKCNETSFVDSVIIQLDVEKPFDRRGFKVEVGSGGPLYWATSENEVNTKHEWAFALLSHIQFLDLKENILVRDSAFDRSSMRDNIFKYHGVCVGIFTFSLAPKKTWSLDFSAIPQDYKLPVVEKSLNIDSTTNFQTKPYQIEVTPHFEIGVSEIENKKIFIPISFDEFAKSDTVVLKRRRLERDVEAASGGECKLFKALRQSQAKKNINDLQEVRIILK